MEKIVESFKGKKVRIFTKTGYVITDATLVVYTDGMLHLKESNQYIDITKPGTGIMFRPKTLYVELSNIDMIGEE